MDGQRDKAKQQIVPFCCCCRMRWGRPLPLLYPFTQFMVSPVQKAIRRRFRTPGKRGGTQRGEGPKGEQTPRAKGAKGLIAKRARREGSNGRAKVRLRPGNSGSSLITRRLILWPGKGKIDHRRRKGPNMAKRSSRLPLLSILCAALVLICLAAFFIWMRQGKIETTGEGMEASEQNKPTPTEDTTEGPTSEKAEATTMATESTTTEEMAARNQRKQVPICEVGEVAEQQLQCETEERRAIPSPEKEEQWAEGQSPVELLRPLEYSLNLSMAREHTALDFSLSLLVELERESNVLVLHCGREVKLDEQDVRIWSCSSGSPICVHSLTRLLDRQLLLVQLSRLLPAGSLLRIQFAHLHVSLTAPNAGLLFQTPSPWERDRAWMLGSQFPLAGGIRTVPGDGGIRLFLDRKVIPSVDEQRARAVFKLCIVHPKETIARSNSPVANSREAEHGNLLLTCFRATPALSPSQFAFLLFRNLRPVSANSSSIELFIGAHLNPDDYSWAIAESQRTIRRMLELTGVPYPLDKFTLVSSPLAPGNDALGAMGLVQIRDSWMEYPKFVHTHNLLVGQLVRQWSGNVLSVCDQCFQRGIGLYLEWLVGSEITAEPQTEFQRRFGEARERLLSKGMTMSSTLQTREMLFNQGNNVPSECEERVAVLVHILSHSFGKDKIEQFLALLFRRHTWDLNCTSMQVLSELYAEASGSAQAKQVFDSFLLPAPSTSTQPIPLVLVQVQPQSSLLRLSQLNNTNTNLSIPIEMVDDTLKNVAVLLNSTEMDVPMLVSSFITVQPVSFARFIYNVENYAKLSQCIGKEKQQACPAVDDSKLRNVWNDLCWALFAQQLPVQEGTGGLPSWKALFQTLHAKGAVHGDCACCLQHKTEALVGHCRWTWLDKCQKIELLDALN